MQLHQGSGVGPCRRSSRRGSARRRRHSGRPRCSAWPKRTAWNSCLRSVGARRPSCTGARSSACCSIAVPCLRLQGSVRPPVQLANALVSIHECDASYSVRRYRYTTCLEAVRICWPLQGPCCACSRAGLTNCVTLARVQFRCLSQLMLICPFSVRPFSLSLRDSLQNKSHCHKRSAGCSVPAPLPWGFSRLGLLSSGCLLLIHLAV